MNIKQKMASLFIATLLVLVAGCATATPQEVASADFGPYPVSYESDIKNVLSGMLKDPYSAVYRFGTPRKGMARDGFAMGGKKHFGWIVQVGVNAKNGFGGYTGEKVFYFMIAEGQVGDVTGMVNSGMAKAL